jgi:hypothetical protein
MEGGKEPREYWVQTQPWLLPYFREAGEPCLEYLQVGSLAEHSLNILMPEIHGLSGIHRITHSFSYMRKYPRRLDGLINVSRTNMSVCSMRLRDADRLFLIVVV